MQNANAGIHALVTSPVQGLLLLYLQLTYTLAKWQIFFLEHSSHLPCWGSHLPCWGLFSCFFYLQGSLHHVWNKPMRSPVHQEGGVTRLASWIPPNRSLFYLVLAPLLGTLLVQYYVSHLWAETIRHLSKGAWESYCHLLAGIALLQSS